jgi:hypothetical protein
LEVSAFQIQKRRNLQPTISNALASEESVSVPENSLRTAWFTCEPIGGNRKQMLIELGHTNRNIAPAADASSRFAQLKAMVCESVGPVRHEVSVPFHDSQVRGVALLIQTGWDRFWRTDAYWEPGPYLAEHLILRMVRSGVKLVGVDFPVAGRSSDTRLLTSGQIPIVENLRALNSLPRVGFRFSAVPIETSEPGRIVHAYADVK